MPARGLLERASRWGRAVLGAGRSGRRAEVVWRSANVELLEVERRSAGGGTGRACRSTRPGLNADGPAHGQARGRTGEVLRVVAGRLGHAEREGAGGELAFEVQRVAFRVRPVAGLAVLFAGRGRAGLV